MTFKGDPYISGFTEYYSPKIKSLSPYIIAFVINDNLHFDPIWMLANYRLEQALKGGEGDY